MSNTKHTAEPWEVIEEHEGKAIGSNALSKTICTAHTSRTWNMNSEEGKANAKRIVACVNACKGVPNEWLQSNAVQSRIDEIAELKRQREHYKAALERVATELRDSENTDLLEFITTVLQ